MKVILVCYGDYEIEAILGVFTNPSLAIASAFKHLSKEKKYHKEFDFSYMLYNQKLIGALVLYIHYIRAILLIFIN